MPSSEGSHPPSKGASCKELPAVYLRICQTPVVGAWDAGRRGETGDDSVSEHVEWVEMKAVG